MSGPFPLDKLGKKKGNTLDHTVLHESNILPRDYNLWGASGPISSTYRTLSGLQRQKQENTFNFRDEYRYISVVLILQASGPTMSFSNLIENGLNSKQVKCFDEFVK